MRSIALSIGLTVLNLPIMFFGLWFALREGSLAAMTVLLLLVIGPLSIVVFAWVYIRRRSEDASRLERYSRIWSVPWNVAIPVGIFLPLVLNGDYARLVTLTPIGLLAAINILTAVFPQKVFGEPRDHASAA